jgi:hypothetical protein
MMNKLGSKVLDELRQLLQIALYLYVCLIALLLYASSIAGAQHIAYMHVGYAAVKALVLAKFVLLGHWLHLGERHRNRRLIYSALYQALALWALLVVLSLIEQFAEGFFHGHSMASGIAELTGNSVGKILAQSLILFLVLFPYVALRQLGAVMGPGRLKQLFLTSPG